MSLCPNCNQWSSYGSVCFACHAPRTVEQYNADVEKSKPVHKNDHPVMMKIQLLEQEVTHLKRELELELVSSRLADQSFSRLQTKMLSYQKVLKKVLRLLAEGNNEDEIERECKDVLEYYKNK